MVRAQRECTGVHDWSRLLRIVLIFVA
jgi:hypothetical protein